MATADLNGIRHCQNCGATDRESLEGDQGYTACCNERVVYECMSPDCGHLETRVTARKDFTS